MLESIRRVLRDRTVRSAPQLLALAVACPAVAAFAQQRLDRKMLDSLALLAYACAGLGFAWVFGGQAVERVEVSDSGSTSPPGGALAPVCVLLGVGVLGCLDFGGNRFRTLGLLLWSGGLLLSLAYLYLYEVPSDRRQGAPTSAPKRSAIWLLLGAAVVVGTALRLSQLDVIPADIGWDLPYNYTDTLSILRGEYHIFFPANQGREGLFFYLIALASRFGSLSHFTMKLTSALIGIATIPAVFLLGRELFNDHVGLTASFLLAVNRWHVVLSRSGFRVILLPLFVILMLSALVRAVRSLRLFDFAVAGLVLGLGCYTYTSFLFMPIALGAGLVLHGLGSRPGGWRRLLPLLGLMLAVSLVVLAPMLRFALEFPQQYLQRVAVQVRILEDPSRPRMNLSLFLENVRTSLLMYNVLGDSNARFNVPGQRHFGFVSAVLLVLGLCYAVRRWRQGYNGMLLAGFFAFILPMTVSMVPHEMPNVFRGAGTLGPALVLASLPLAAVLGWLRDASLRYPEWDARLRLHVLSPLSSRDLVLKLGRRDLLRVVSVLAAVLLLAVELSDTRRFYFVDYAAVLPDRENVSIAREIARQMEAYGDLDSCYVKVWPYWFDGRALRTYLRQPEGAWNPEFSDLVPGQPPLSLVTERALFILHPEDTQGLSALRDAFPHSASQVHRLPDGTPAFLTVYVER